MILNYKAYNYNKSETILILHGLLGSNRNWASIAKQLPYRVLCFDLRNHGDSGHDPDMRYDTQAQDVADTIASLYPKIIPPVRAIVGHSMGGKVALQLAYNTPEIVKQLIIVDSVPKAYAPGRHQHLFAACLKLPLDMIQTRTQADAHLQAAVPDASLRAFLLQNLRLNPTRWRVPLRLLQDNDKIIMGMPPWQHPLATPTAFIYGHSSDYMNESDYPLIREKIKAPRFYPMPGSHWLHAEYPDLFLENLQLAISLVE